MLTTSTLVLVMCVAVCVQGDVFSDNTDQKTMETAIKDTNAVLDQVLQELRYLRDEDTKKTDEINNLKDEDKKKTDEINNLKDEDKKNKDEITSLKVEDIKNRDENRKNRDEIDNLKADVQKNKNKFEKNEDEIHHLQAEDKKNKERIENLTGQTTNSQTAVASAAFTAVMDVGTLYPDPGDVIPFNTVWLNLGQHYDNQTSIFTCAESGLYLFSVTLASGSITSGTDYYRLSGALMLDGEKVAEVLSENGDPDHYQHHQSAVTAVVECPKGGSVWVECQYDYSRIYGYDYQPRSVFTGFAITYNIHP